VEETGWLPQVLHPPEQRESGGAGGWGVCTVYTADPAFSISEKERLERTFCTCVHCHSTVLSESTVHPSSPEAVDTNGRFQMQGVKNWILPK
jgi:hypothetical protein